MQLSRELNPANIEDAAYLQGLTPAERKLAPGARVVRRCSSRSTTTPPGPLPAATDLTITDTQDNIYTPDRAERRPTVRLPRRPGAGQGPDSRSPTRSPPTGATQGALLLYKIQVVSLDNRPLELKIVDPNDPSQTASAELDV